MNIDWKCIGQRCQGITKKGKQCRLPASTIAGGLAACPYHIKQSVKRFREVEAHNPDYQELFDHARRDSQFC